MSLLLIASLPITGFAVQTKTKAIRSAKALFENNPFTLMCEKPIDDNGQVEVRPCDLCPTTPQKVRWISLIPTKRLASDRLCYQEKICSNYQGKPTKGLMCCREVDDFYNEMESDLHLYVPEEPQIANLLNHSHFGQIELQQRQYLCDMHYDLATKTVQPPPHAKGLIARTYLYFESRYGLLLSEQEKKVFLQWHYEHPASQWERERNQEIYVQSGLLNTWVH